VPEDLELPVRDMLAVLVTHHTVLAVAVGVPALQVVLQPVALRVKVEMG
jgi:hypothetical protein